MSEEFDVIVVGGGHAGCEAALAAALNWKFSPAKQRDKFVRVYVSIPINFRLVDSG